MTFNLFCFKLSWRPLRLRRDLSGEPLSVLNKMFAAVSWVNWSRNKCKVIFPCGYSHIFFWLQCDEDGKAVADGAAMVSD